MAYERRNYAGGAAPTTLGSGISATDLTITLASATGWPSGGASGPFFVVIDRGLSSEEKVEVASRTGTSLTVASVGKRGVDGTAAAVHAIGASIEHCFTAQDADEANAHVTDDTRDDHSQYMLSTGTRHDLTARHVVGTVLPSTGTPGTIQPDDTASAGVANSVARMDHRHAIGAATAVTSGLANAEGVSTSFARADHTHDQAALSVGTAELVDGSATTAKIGDSQVTTAKIADANVTLAKMASEASASYVPTLSNVTLGAGTSYAYYYKIGRLVVLTGGFVLGAGANVTGLIGFSLPPAITPAFPAGVERYVFGAWAQDVSASSRFAASCTIDVGDPTRVSRFVNAGTTTGFDGPSPFNWASGDMLFFTGFYIATA